MDPTQKKKKIKKSTLNKSGKKKKKIKKTVGPQNERPLEKKLPPRAKNLEEEKTQPKRTTKTKKKVIKTKGITPLKKVIKTKETVSSDVEERDGRNIGISKTNTLLEKEKISTQIGGKDLSNQEVKRSLKVFEEDSTQGFADASVLSIYEPSALRDKLRDSVLILKEKITKQKDVSYSVEPTRAPDVIKLRKKQVKVDETPLLTMVDDSKINTGIFFKDVPVKMTCFNCQQNITTDVIGVPGRKTYVISGILCSIMAWIGCQFMPFCVESCLDLAHMCPLCEQELGRFVRWR